jgi:hypothetical protein
MMLLFAQLKFHSHAPQASASVTHSSASWELLFNSPQPLPQEDYLTISLSPTLQTTAVQMAQIDALMVHAELTVLTAQLAMDATILLGHTYAQVVDAVFLQ